MTTYLVRRLIQALFIIIIVSLIIFFMMRLLPGDPLLMYLNEEQFDVLTPEQLQIMRHELGLDKSLILQYGDWLAGIFRGDFGTSLYYRENVGVLLVERLPVTLHLGLISFILGHLIGMIFGVVSAVRQGSAKDLIVTFFANIGITIPVFWLGIVLIYLFGLQLRWLPICGYTSPFEDFWLSTKQIILPIFCLSIGSVASTARQTRSSMLEVTRQDYIRTAWSKGLRERSVIIRHILKNGLIPVVTLSGMGLSTIIGGSVLIETVFNIPGMGRLAVDAVLGLDYIVVQAIILIAASMVVFANLLVDISYGWLDPRIRYE